MTVGHCRAGFQNEPLTGSSGCSSPSSTMSPCIGKASYALCFTRSGTAVANLTIASSPRAWTSSPTSGRAGKPSSSPKKPEIAQLRNPGWGEADRDRDPGRGNGCLDVLKIGEACQPGRLTYALLSVFAAPDFASVGNLLHFSGCFRPRGSPDTAPSDFVGPICRGRRRSSSNVKGISAGQALKPGDLFVLSA